MEGRALDPETRTSSTLSKDPPCGKTAGAGFIEKYLIPIVALLLLGSYLLLHVELPSNTRRPTQYQNASELDTEEQRLAALFDSHPEIVDQIGAIVTHSSACISPDFPISPCPATGDFARFIVTDLTPYGLHLLHEYLLEQHRQREQLLERQEKISSARSQLESMLLRDLDPILNRLDLDEYYHLKYYIETVVEELKLYEEVWSETYGKLATTDSVIIRPDVVTINAGAALRLIARAHGQDLVNIIRMRQESIVIRIFYDLQEEEVPHDYVVSGMAGRGPPNVDARIVAYIVPRTSDIHIEGGNGTVTQDISIITVAGDRDVEAALGDRAAIWRTLQGLQGRKRSRLAQTVIQEYAGGSISDLPIGEYRRMDELDREEEYRRAESILIDLRQREGEFRRKEMEARRRQEKHHRFLLKGR